METWLSWLAKGSVPPVTGWSRATPCATSMDCHLRLRRQSGDRTGTDAHVHVPSGNGGPSRGTGAPAARGFRVKAVAAMTVLDSLWPKRHGTRSRPTKWRRNRASTLNKVWGPKRWPAGSSNMAPTSYPPNRPRANGSRPGASSPTVKGAPDVVVERCGRPLWHDAQVPMSDVRDEILAANQQLSERGCECSLLPPATWTTRR